MKKLLAESVWPPEPLFHLSLTFISPHPRAKSCDPKSGVMEKREINFVQAKIPGFPLGSIIMILRNYPILPAILRRSFQYTDRIRMCSRARVQERTNRLTDLASLPAKKPIRAPYKATRRKSPEAAIACRYDSRLRLEKTAQLNYFARKVVIH